MRDWKLQTPFHLCSLSASQPSTPSAPLEVSLVSAGLDDFFLGSLPLFVSTLSVCEDIFSSAHEKGPPITHESCDKDSCNPENTQKSPLEVLSVMNINRI